MLGKRGAEWQAEAGGCPPEQGAELVAAGGAKQARTEADARSKGCGAAPDAVASTAGTENIVLINSTDGIEQCMRDEKILQLWQSRCAIDIVFESSTNKQTLEAHRLVLAMQSPKLKELISSDLFFQPENGNGRMSFVSMSNPVHFEALSVILDWIYKVRSQHTYHPRAPRKAESTRARARRHSAPPPAQVPAALHFCRTAEYEGGAGQVHFAAIRRHRTHRARVQLHVGHGPDKEVSRGPRLCPSHARIVRALPREHLQEIHRR